MEYLFRNNSPDVWWDPYAFSFISLLGLQCCIMGKLFSHGAETLQILHHHIKVTVLYLESGLCIF